MDSDIYGPHRSAPERVMEGLVRQVEDESRTENGEKLYEHLLYRVKRDESMRGKLRVGCAGDTISFVLEV